MDFKEELTRQTTSRDTVITVGVFDGVHLGHQRLIGELLSQAKERGLESIVITFRQHPEQVLGQAATPFLTTTGEKARLLTGLGVDRVIVVDFSPELAGLPAHEFLGLLKEYLHLKSLVVGPDFALGRERAGDTRALRRLSAIMDFSLTVVPPVVLDGQVVSSTAIRQALAAGDVRLARRLLGRDFSIEGQVVKGSGRGTGLGFATANLDVPVGQALPADGVYAAVALASGSRYHAVVNIGQCPTFDDTGHRVEAHLLDFSGNLLGQELRLEFKEHLRPEQRFDSPAALSAQVRQDIAKARQLLSSTSVK